MLSSWRTVILQLDLALPLLSLCLRYFQFIYCSCQFDDFKISLNSFNDCFDPITSSACTAEQEALAPPFQPWAWTFSQTECIERPENTQFKSFRSWESVTNLILWVKSFHTLLKLCVEIDDSTCDGIVGDLVAIVHQDEEQVKPGHQLLVTPISEPTNKKTIICAFCPTSSTVQ